MPLKVATWLQADCERALLWESEFCHMPGTHGIMSLCVLPVGSG